MADFKYIFQQFEVSGFFDTIQQFGNGHIHSTFLVKTKGKTTPNYILQKMNQHVFSDPLHLQENIQKITQYLVKSKCNSRVQRDHFQYLNIYPTLQGDLFIQDSKGDYWRIFNFIEGAKSSDLVENPIQAYQAGKIIGHFQKSLVNFPVSQLYDTIPNFHNLEWRLTAFDQVLLQNSMDRIKSAQKEISYIHKMRENLLRIHFASKSGDIPIRVTHNDTKFNNILLNEHDRAVSLIDLDTVMSGMVHFDFGDAIRNITNDSAEDVEDLSQAKINFVYLKAFIRGYIGEAKAFLTQKEIAHLPEAPAMMTFMLGVRFLTDYLEGDNYFRIHYPSQNLRRVKVQFAMVENFLHAKQQISAIIQQLL